jgi:hypothetical protein
MARRYDVRITKQARDDLRRVPLPDRGRLTMRVISLSAREPDAGLHAVRSWRYLMACEVFPRSRLVLVYAVRERATLHHELTGG